MKEYIVEGNQFITAEEQLGPTAKWGVANVGELGKCNTDKKELRQWVKEQQAIFEK